MVLYNSLTLSIQTLQKSKYGKGNKKKLSAILRALNRASPIFKNKNLTENNVIKQISFRNIPPQDQIPKILDEFMDAFEKECLEEGNGSAKNYSIFAVTCYKIIRTLESGKPRGLLSAHTLNRLNKMFVKHPVKYNKQAIHDPLGLLFVIIELAIDIDRNLSVPYKFDQTILDQMIPLMQKYYTLYSDSIGQILNEFSNMPKFKLVVEIGDSHKRLVKIFLDFGIRRLQLDIRIQRAKSILEKIISEEVDSVALGYYENLQMAFSDSELKPYLVKIAQDISKTNRRFANTVLEEISKL